MTKIIISKTEAIKTKTPETNAVNRIAKVRQLDACNANRAFLQAQDHEGKNISFAFLEGETYRYRLMCWIKGEEKTFFIHKKNGEVTEFHKEGRIETFEEVTDPHILDVVDSAIGIFYQTHGGNDKPSQPPGDKELKETREDVHEALSRKSA